MRARILLKAELDPGVAVRPLRSAPHKGGRCSYSPTLRRPLDRLLGRPMELTQFWARPSAVSCARPAAWVRPRPQGRQPANILVNRASGEHAHRVWHPSRLPRERQSPQRLPSSSPGRSAYMAPEQTGRIESLDRSPQRPLLTGVTSTRCLTGSLRSPHSIRWSGSTAISPESRCRQASGEKIPARSRISS